MDYVELNYEPVGWKNYPSTSTKLNAENLNKPEEGIQMLIKAVLELRTVLGSENLTENYSGLIAAVNDLSGKFGGYSGYNLLDMSLLTEESNGYSISGTLEKLGLVADTSYTLSMEGNADIYFYQYDDGGEMISTEILTDGEAISFTINSGCNSIKIFFPKTLGYTSEELCINAKVMLEAGTEKHSYEPYTGGEEMRDLWQEILENQNMIAACKTAISKCESFLEDFSDLLEGSY